MLNNLLKQHQNMEWNQSKTNRKFKNKQQEKNFHKIHDDSDDRDKCYRSGFGCVKTCSNDRPTYRQTNTITNQQCVFSKEIFVKTIMQHIRRRSREKKEIKHAVKASEELLQARFRLTQTILRTQLKMWKLNDCNLNWNCESNCSILRIALSVCLAVSV